MRIALLSLLLLATGSCASGRAPQVGSEGISREIDVDNGTSIDLEIRALYGNLQIPIGNVRARQNRAMRLPAGAPSNYRLIAEPLGGGIGGRLYSEPISGSDERRVTWEIRSNGTAVVIYGRGALRP